MVGQEALELCAQLLGAGHLAGLAAFIPMTTLPGVLAPHAARAALEKEVA